LYQGLHGLSSNYECLDASRPWLCYWIVHSLDLLDALNIDKYAPIRQAVVEFLRDCCQSPTGGFCGGPMQVPHLAPTYAAVNTLVILGAYDAINRPNLYKFLCSTKDKKSGGFCMHVDGEVDVRGAYCAMSVANLTNLITPELTDGVADYVLACQTYEGGIGSYPGNEAHGGYAFCGLACMLLMGVHDKLDLKSFMRWCVARQTSFEGGFNGRSNKLVDGCYSFWIGGCFPLLQAVEAALKPNKKLFDIQLMDYVQMNVSQADREAAETLAAAALNESGTPIYVQKPEILHHEVNFPELEDTEWIFDQTALQEYIILCCQQPSGGLRDKPGKSRDYYHTCYTLSGLSIAQHNPSRTSTVLGDSELNKLREINPVFNICKDKVLKAWIHFGQGLLKC